MQDVIQVAAKAGKIKVWALGHAEPEEPVKWEFLKIDFLSCMGYGDNAKLIDF